MCSIPAIGKQEVKWNMSWDHGNTYMNWYTCYFRSWRICVWCLHKQSINTIRFKCLFIFLERVTKFDKIPCLYFVFWLGIVYTRINKTSSKHESKLEIGMEKWPTFERKYYFAFLWKQKKKSEHRCVLTYSILNLDSDWLDFDCL